MRNVVPFRDHLCAHQDVVIALAETVEDGFKSASTGGSIPIEPGDPRSGKIAVQLLFDALRSQAEEVDMVARTFRAGAGRLLGVAAIVAQQASIALVEGEGHRAVHAFDALATRPARDKA